MQHLSVINCLLPVICCNFNQQFAKVILKRQTPYMNTRILLLVATIAVFSSCSVYRSGQTPDDVYYSPARTQVEKDSYVEVRQDKPGTNYQSYEQYQDSYRDDRFLRMSVRNPYYMNSYNAYSGFDWRYNSFYDGFNYGYNSPWNNYFAWNNFYNPYAISFGSYYGGGYYGGGSYYTGGGYYGGGAHYAINAAPISRPRVFNVNSYSNSNRNAGRPYSNGSNYNNTQRYNNGNSSGNRSYYNNSNGSNNRSMYTPSNSGNSSNSNSNNSPSRSYTPSSSGSSSSGSSSSGSSGGGGVSRPTRGN